MSCLNPVLLKSGITVPCGKCDVCLSDRRTQWSIRLALHASYCDRMPLFICLTYDHDHLPLQNSVPTLKRDDVSVFLKAYKRKYALTNDKFQYFGCGEYGDTFNRPHYHLLFFGDNDLYDLYFRDSEAAQKQLEDVWQKGFCSIGIAQWSGIHYVTKYILKEEFDELEQFDVVPPFLIASKGLGNSFLDSLQAIEWSKQIQWLAYNKDYVFSLCPNFSLDDPSTLDDALNYLRQFVPSWRVLLDDGRFVQLPRVLRLRLLGSFQHFKDSPLWLYQSILNIKRSLKYYQENGAYDATHEKESWRDKLEVRTLKIQQRLLKRKFDNIYKRSKV